jgi:nucleoside-diphosphate kinase
MKTLQRTFAIIKPDAVSKGHQGEIISLILKSGFNIVGMKMLHITQKQAEGFYAVHAGKPFFASLTRFMASGPIVVLGLEKEGDAIGEWRKLMGATNPANAEAGTIRKQYAESIERNAVHGSDAEDTARFELSYFFAGYELAQ